jgi:hypothetical protein
MPKSVAARIRADRETVRRLNAELGDARLATASHPLLGQKVQRPVVRWRKTMTQKGVVRIRDRERGYLPGIGGRETPWAPVS